MHYLTGVANDRVGNYSDQREIGRLPVAGSSAGTTGVQTPCLRENILNSGSCDGLDEYPSTSCADHEAALRGSGPEGGSFACRSNKEVMLCAHLILLLSIVPPSASTGYFPCSTNSAGWT